MQRWHLTAGLAGATALAALILPSIRGAGLGSGAGRASGEGVLPPPVEVEPGLPPAGFDGALELEAALDQGAVIAGAGEDRFLVVEVRAPELQGDLRRPVDLAVVMDTSGSMAGRGKIEDARMAAQELVDQLGPQDSFALVSFADSGRVVVESAPVTDPARLKRLVASINPGGGTHLSSGLELGLAQLDRPDREGVRRVVLLSDGMANIGVTDTAALARIAGGLVDQGVTVSALGLGLDYNEDLLTAMSDAGGGQYHFVDRPGQLAAMFSQELQQMTRVAGREVAVEVALPPGVVLQEVYGWSASPTADGYRVFLGDVHGGEVRKVVARVRVDAAEAGRMPVAEVDLRYTDADSERAAEERVAVAAEVTRDAAVVRASVNKPQAVAAARAWAGDKLDESARSYAQGDVAANQATLEATKRELRNMLSAYDAPELEADLADIDQQQAAFGAAAPASDEGLYQVKKSKEAARGYAR
ncbi:VWA domain-containing protein [Myxococcota bacterium]|nr:VWA domain-containing protein [Myxococcota bacterium]